ncbi:MAG: endopeptidase La, partial [Clostridia bacterium]|nr:endopeptidase La [Clostridia bacterium]
MSKYIEKVEKNVYPLLKLRNVVIFPALPTSIEIAEEEDIAVVNAALSSDSYVFASAINPDKDVNDISEVYSVGVAAKVKQAMKLPDGHMRVLLEGKKRAELSSVEDVGGLMYAEVFVRSVSLTDNGGLRGELLMREAAKEFQEFLKYLPKVSNEIVAAIQAIREPGFMADFITANVIYKLSARQDILSEINPLRRLEKLLVIMANEKTLLESEVELQTKVKQRIDQNQREYYLREQLKVIQNELGDGEFSDIDEYDEKIKAASLPEDVEEKLRKELSKLEKMPYSSAESTVIRNYLDICLEIPWSVRSKGRYDVAAAKKILDADHDGLDKVKDRILEYIAVRQMSPSLSGQILCLVGPPGVGKSSVVSSVARALGREFVRVSLGGVRDEADIRGHRKTYIASMPGRIANALKTAGTMNPVILLDEVDKLTSDAHGDPASALLEVLDNDQNKNFRDHFLEIPLDLSDCVFVATANTLDTVSRPLIDRMEIISISSYTRSEKISIFKNHLLPKELKRHGLTRRALKITDDAICEMIDFYTKESGVRNLSREAASLCRKVARKIVETGKKSFSVTSLNLTDYLGKRKYRDPETLHENLVGVVNGLAWTEVGGELLQSEAVATEGTGKLELTGKLGDVMKESAHAAVTYVRKNYEKYGIDKDFYKNRDLHIHFPEGAVPKDGPSAGVTCATAIVSELSGIPVRGDVAMTGEITLHGRVLPIGGLREKSMAAYKHGMKIV